MKVSPSIGDSISTTGEVTNGPNDDTLDASAGFDMGWFNFESTSPVKEMAPVTLDDHDGDKKGMDDFLKRRSKARKIFDGAY